MSEETTIPQSEETALVPQRNLRLVAFDPAQLQESQKQLIAWCDGKLAAVQKEVDGFTENLRISKEAKWNTARPRAALKEAEGRMVYYQKIYDALQAGYYIVPDFPCDIFAIRTDWEGPTGVAAQNVGTHKAKLWNRPQGSTGELRSSEGEYVHPTPASSHEHEKMTVNNETKWRNTLYQHGWKDVVFPFALAKPEVLNMTQRAMALKIFDELGACPPRRRNKDPMVLGIIKGPKDRRMMFLVAWFLDTETI